MLSQPVKPEADEGAAGQTPGASAAPAASEAPAAGEAKASESEPVDENDEELASRALLSGLASVPPKSDLTKAVPDLIHRRSRGRFFGRKRLAERLPLEWISLAMLIVLAATYALLKLFFTD